MQASGCAGVFLGIESGDETILRNNEQAGLARQVPRRDRTAETQSDSDLCVFILVRRTADTIEHTARFLEEDPAGLLSAKVYYHSKSVPIQLEAARFGLTRKRLYWRHATMDGRRPRRSGQVAAVDSGPVIGTSNLSTFWMIGYLPERGSVCRTSAG